MPEHLYPLLRPQFSCIMSALAMRMPPHLESTATLATQVVDAQVPEWAATRVHVALNQTGTPEDVHGRRSERDVFRLPNSNEALWAWLFTRPEVEALDEDAFANCALESSTIFRIEKFDHESGLIEISPTVSNHWLLVPMETINGVTVGITYLDLLYQRKDNVQDCVPPYQVGKFALEETSGEVFVTAWTGPTMTVAWIQSIVKCERVREFLLYQAPPANGIRPRKLILRNSFYERRDCRLCGTSVNLNNMQPPCSGVKNNHVHDQVRDTENSRPSSNVAGLYRRFRGGYFGVCLKTAFKQDGRVEKNLVPVFTDVKHGLYSVKQRFRQNLEQNCHFSLNRLFGLHPALSSRMFFLKTTAPLSSVLQICDSDTKKRKGQLIEDRKPQWSCQDGGRSPVSVADCDTSTITSDRSDSPPARRRRRVGIDEVDRQSIEFERKRRNRIAAERSNRLRKEKLEQDKRELKELKDKVEMLREKQLTVIAENQELKEYAQLLGLQ